MRYCAICLRPAMQMIRDVRGVELPVCDLHRTTGEVEIDSRHLLGIGVYCASCGELFSDVTEECDVCQGECTECCACEYKRVEKGEDD
jgi:hypothetical protein